MRINVAHLQEQNINFVVFEAKPRVMTEAGHQALLDDLTMRARALGWLVEKSALAYNQHGRIRYWGTPDLVRWLANGWIPDWTHTLTVS